MGALDWEPLHEMEKLLGGSDWVLCVLVSPAAPVTWYLSSFIQKYLLNTGSEGSLAPLTWAEKALFCVPSQWRLYLWLCKDPTPWPFGVSDFLAWWSHVYFQLQGSFWFSLETIVASVSKSECFGGNWGSRGENVSGCCNSHLRQAWTVCQYPSVYRTKKKRKKLTSIILELFWVVGFMGGISPGFFLFSIALSFWKKLVDFNF